MFRFDRSYDPEEFAAVAQRIDAIAPVIAAHADTAERDARQIGRASCRERV